MPDSKTQELVNKQCLWTRYLQAVAKNISQPVAHIGREHANYDLV